MFDRVSNREVTEAIDTLIASIGIKKEVSCKDLPRLLRKGDVKGCVQEIASRLGLPVRIELLYVPKNFIPDNPNRFESNSFAKTDRRGRGIEGITAQVFIPQNMPMFGTAELDGYSIKVLVSENCNHHMHAFIATMLHELSHVLLSSLWSPHKKSELHTDLVPIILGFRETVRRGRKVIETTNTAKGTETKTTSYGYLTDGQFDLACKYVTDLLSSHLTLKKNLTRAIEHLQRKLEKVVLTLVSFQDYFRYLDANPPKSMKREHGQKIVKLHGHDQENDWERKVARIREQLEKARIFVSHMDNHHYFLAKVEQMVHYAKVLKSDREELDQLIKIISRNKKILGKYVPLICRVRRAWFHRPLTQTTN